METSRLLRLALWPAAFAVGGLTAWLILENDALTEPDPELAAGLGLAIGLSWCISGLIAWQRRPGNRIGPLMVLTGFAFFVSGFQYSAYSVPFTIGLLLEPFYIAVFAHLLLAFPTGRLESRFVRVLVAAVYVDVTLFIFLAALFDPIYDPENLVLVWPNEGVAEAFANVSRSIGIVLSLIGLGVLVQRWRRGTAPWRRAAAPVLWTGGIAIAAGIVGLVNETAGEPLGGGISFFWFGFAAVPLGFLAGLLRSRLDRASVAQLVVELGRATAPGRLREVLSRALHDPSLDVAYWLPDLGRYVDVEGRPVELPSAGGQRSTTVVELEGRRVAALVHDRSLTEEPELVDAACAAAALALENERLAAELRARLEELRASRVRIVEATDEERRRIERNLHDGTQQRLVSISMALGLAESRLPPDAAEAREILGEARASLGQALAELRELSQGIHPSILTERGLVAALHELSYDTSLPVQLDVALDERLPEPVEAAAYYLVAESLANVAKHADASAAQVRVSRENGRALVEVTDNGNGGADPAGSGLRGLADRVEALGGRLAVDSSPGHGTRVQAEIPCG